MIVLSDYKECQSKSHSCEESGHRFEIIAAEEERKFLLRTKVDKCVYSDKSIDKKCDYVFEYKDSFSCFVELKGKDIEHATKQLESSLNAIQVRGKKYAFIVSSRNAIPNMTIWKQKIIKKFHDKYNAKFDIKNAQLSKKIKNELLE